MFIEDEGAHVARKKNPQHPFFPYVATPFLPYVQNECFFCSFFRCSVPRRLWEQMRADDSLVIRLNVPHEARLERLVREYGVHPVEELAGCVEAMRKRLGAERTEYALKLLGETPAGLSEVADLLLKYYYDMAYDKKAAQRPGEQRILECDTREGAVDQAAEQAFECALQMVKGRLP